MGGGWGAAEHKAGSAVTSALYYSLGSLSFSCVQRTLIGYVYSYTNLFKYFQELSNEHLPGILNTSSLFHYSVLTLTPLT